MNENIRIKLSAGLIFVAVVHAVLLGVVFALLHVKPQVASQESVWQPPAYPTVRDPVSTIQKLDQPQSVNLHAQGEIKQQRPVCPNNCSPGYVVVPNVPRPVVNTPVIPTPVYLPAATPVSPAVPAPVRKSFEIALFVSGDAQSKQLQTWFETHPGLVRLKQNCEFQIYTASNPLYKTRFAQIVPADQFPVVLFQDTTGGHVHAAGRNMIPRTADELYSDLKQGYELYQQAKQAQKTGAVKSRGYSWDAAISPTLYLSSEDCPDGYCPNTPSDVWRPGERVRDRLFDRDRDDRTAFFWLSSGEIATIALIVIAVALLGIILLKRGN